MAFRALCPLPRPALNANGIIILLRCRFVTINLIINVIYEIVLKQAISKVTQVISQGEYAQLNGLLTKAARQSLMRELDRNWGEKQRSLLALHRDDIQISSPRKVYFIRIAGKYFWFVINVCNTITVL